MWKVDYTWKRTVLFRENEKENVDMSLQPW